MINVDKVTKRYRARRGSSLTALDDVSIDIGEGEFVTILGPSGCGKSTLLRLVAGLSQPSSGQIRIDGRVVHRPDPSAAIVFQQPVLLRWRTVLQNVLLPGEIRGDDMSAYRRRANELLEMTGLAGFSDHMPYELSGGMQQRVSLCRALSCDPSILLMDEPFGALDALTREQMQYELLSIWEEQRKTVLFVTHSISEAILLGDRILVMTPRPGRVAELLDVGIPRPRGLSTETTSVFQEHSTHLKSLLGVGDLAHAPSSGQ